TRLTRKPIAGPNRPFPVVPRPRRGRRDRVAGALRFLLSAPPLRALQLSQLIQKVRRASPLPPAPAFASRTDLAVRTQFAALPPPRSAAGRAVVAGQGRPS